MIQSRPVTSPSVPARRLSDRAPCRRAGRARQDSLHMSRTSAARRAPRPSLPLRPRAAPGACRHAARRPAGHRAARPRARAWWPAPASCDPSARPSQAFARAWERGDLSAMHRPAHARGAARARPCAASSASTARPPTCSPSTGVETGAVGEPARRHRHRARPPADAHLRRADRAAWRSPSRDRPDGGVGVDWRRRLALPRPARRRAALARDDDAAAGDDRGARRHAAGRGGGAAVRARRAGRGDRRPRRPGAARAGGGARAPRRAARRRRSA